MTTIDSQRPSGLARRVRAGLIACGGAGTLAAAAAIGWRLSRGGVAGPTQLDIGLVGAGLLIAGLLRSPARVMADAIERARAAGPVTLTPVTRRQRTALAAI